LQQDKHGPTQCLFLCFHSILSCANVLPEQTRCRNIPGDPGLPTADTWDMLNATVGGRLPKTMPLAQPYHHPFDDIVVCNNINRQWPEFPLCSVDNNSKLTFS
jgi:hypothetical protein